MIARRLAAFAAILAGLAVYWDGASNQAERERRIWLVDQMRGVLREPGQEARLAEAYWNRYPDVAANAIFGRNSRLGIGGAREHYNLHGRKEGRVWG